MRLLNIECENLCYITTVRKVRFRLCMALKTESRLIHKGNFDNRIIFLMIVTFFIYSINHHSFSCVLKDGFAFNPMTSVHVVGLRKNNSSKLFKPLPELVM